jgi:hypothetical protein
MPPGAMSQPQATIATRDLGAESPLTAASVRQLIALASAAGRPGRPPRIHLAIDTGGGEGCSAETARLERAVVQARRLGPQPLSVG